MKIIYIKVADSEAYLPEGGEPAPGGANPAATPPPILSQFFDIFNHC